MSDTKLDPKEDFNKNMEKVIEFEKLKTDTSVKKTTYDNKIYTSKLKAIAENERDIEIAENANYGALSEEQIAETVKNNDDYMEAAQNAMSFICPSFKDIIPFFRKNLIVIAGKSGHGKSAAVANIAFNNLMSFNKKTGKTLRTLVITNEERREDFLNRVTSLIKGWHYTRHNEFTKEQRKEFSRMIPILSATGRLTVIDDCHGGSSGVTTSVEGLESIFKSLIRNKEYYDVVIVDYYQNFISSKNSPTLSMYQVQEKVTRLLDNFKNIYPAPVVVMSQLRAEAEENTPFQLRIMGSKSLMVPSTFAAEMILDIEFSRTKWIVHKSRYSGSMGRDFHTGYDNGKFVEYTSEFTEKIQKRAYEKESRRINETIDKNNGLPEVFNDKKEEKE